MFAAPSEQRLPRLGNPRKFAQQGVCLSGQVPLAALERLGEALVTKEGQVEVTLAFGISEERKLVVRGRVNAELSLTCQRCLGPVTVPVEADIALAIVANEEAAKNLPGELDPWLLGEEEINADLYMMVEDELLLNLPAVAYHTELCIDPKSLSIGEPEAAPKENPFQVLEQLKGTPKK